MRLVIKEMKNHKIDTQKTTDRNTNAIFVVNYTTHSKMLDSDRKRQSRDSRKVESERFKLEYHISEHTGGVKSNDHEPKSHPESSGDPQKHLNHPKINLNSTKTTNNDHQNLIQTLTEICEKTNLSKRRNILHFSSGYTGNTRKIRENGPKTLHNQN